MSYITLIKCPECGKEVSDKAKKCIECGCPIKNENRKKGKFMVFAGVFIVVVLAINIIEYVAYTIPEKKESERYKAEQDKLSEERRKNNASARKNQVCNGPHGKNERVISGTLYVDDEVNGQTYNCGPYNPNDSRNGRPVE